MICRFRQVKASGFHAWRRRGPSRHAHDCKRLKQPIPAVHAEPDEVHGSPKVREVPQHSDRASQHASSDFQALLNERGIVCYMSGTGNRFNNAAMESFFGLLKRNCVHRRQNRSRDATRTDVFDYIERFYNRKRRHESAGRMSSLDYDKSVLNPPVH